MNLLSHRSMVSAFLILILLIISGASSVLSAAPKSEFVRLNDKGTELWIIAGEDTGQTPRRSLASEKALSSPKTATINVTYQPSEASWPSGAREAFEYAAGIWESQISSSVPINIVATWEQLDSRILGGSMASDMFANHSYFPYQGTWYVPALGNKLAGSDLDPTNSDIEVILNSIFNWYLGTDGNPSSGAYDLASVILHEIGHGLGFTGSMRVSSSVGSWGYSGYPYIYDRFTMNGSYQALIDTAVFANPSVVLGQQLTSSNIYFNGPNALIANSGSPVKLYIPSTWAQGSSYSHVDEIYNNTANALMTYSLSPAEVQHSLGPITLGILKDLGWTVQSTSSTPTPTRTSAPTATATKKPTPRPFTPSAYIYMPKIEKSYKKSTDVTASKTPSASTYTFYGKVTANGAAAEDIPLDLIVCSNDSVACTITASTVTGSSGNYSFGSAPSLASDEAYYVRYRKTSTSPSGLLQNWYTRGVDADTPAGSVNIGNFDLTNFEIESPAGGVDVPLWFIWSFRQDLSDDQFEVVIFDATTGNPAWTSEGLGHASNYLLEELPEELTPETWYLWATCIYSEDGGQGCSADIQQIMFGSAAVVADDQLIERFLELTTNDALWLMTSR